MSSAWKVIGKMDGQNKIIYHNENYELAHSLLAGDIVELDNGEWAAAYDRDGEIHLFTELDAQQQSFEWDSNRR